MTDRFDICRPMPAQTIKISGARQHNLKNLHVEIPREKLVVITGLSGSGKSSLAFDTLYAEGQRRYVESLSAYARQFLDQMEKPDVDFIEGLSPAIAIEQRSAGANPRSTIATTTEVYDYLRSKKPVRDTLSVNSKDVDDKLAHAAKVVKATYQYPYQMHGSIGSSCAVADVQGPKATVWSAT